MVKRSGLDILSPDSVLLMLVGEAFPGPDGEALGDEFAAPAVPAILCPLLLGKNSAAGRAEDLVCLGILVVHNYFHSITFPLTGGAVRASSLQGTTVYHTGDNRGREVSVCSSLSRSSQKGHDIR